MEGYVSFSHGVPPFPPTPYLYRMRLRWRLAQFFEIRWWRGYLRGKETHEYLQKKKHYWQDQLDLCSEVFTVRDSDSVLDVGCGPSGIYMMFPDNAVTAVDPLLSQYERDLPVFSRAMYPNVQFVESTIEQYAPTQRFDYVFCMNAINHVSDIAMGFQVLADCCSVKGKLVVTIDAHNNQFMKAIFRIGPGDVLHPHQYDMAEYVDFLRENKCEVIKTICLSKGLVFSHFILIAEKK